MLFVYYYNCLKPKNFWKIISRSNQIKIEIYNLHACLHACGKKYLLPHYVWTYFNRNNQTFTKFRNILKEYFLKLRIGF
jgi:hypothetical protein